jgi:Fusaric acid resistance protein-like
MDNPTIRPAGIQVVSSASSTNAPQRNTFRSAGIPAARTIVATVAAFCTVYAISKPFHAGPNAAILSAVLALTQGRLRTSSDHSPWVKLATFPIVAVGVSAIGWLLHNAFVVGAVVYITAMSFSIWSRQFGETTRRIGSIAALPLVAVLIAPAPPHAPGGHLINVFLVIVAGVTAYAWLIALAEIAKRAGLIVSTPATFTIRAVEAQRKKGTLSPHTRMAIQMAVALTAAFVIGRVAFAHHWSWVVLTAFIVCSGSVSRGDAVYKGFLRLVGATAGTLVAALVQYIYAPQGSAAAALIFGVLFVGLWLREINYAWWAACITLVIAVLQSTGARADASILHLRLLEILIGALCGAGATWFVLPIPTELLVRRRIADALLALDEFASADNTSPEERHQRLQIFQEHIARLDSVAPPVEFHRHVMFQHRNVNHPATWIHQMKQCAHRIDAFEGSQKDLVRAIRHTRKTLGQRELPLSDPLQRLNALLNGHERQ